MPSSRIPGPIDGYLQATNVQDGTAPRIAMPAGGSVGTSSHASQSPRAASAAAAAAQQAAIVDKDGVLKSTRVKPSIASTIERGPMTVVRGIILHQTGGSTAQSALIATRTRARTVRTS